MAVRRLRTDGTGSAVIAAVNNAQTGVLATNGVIANTSQGAQTLAQKSELTVVADALNSLIAACKAHGVVNAA